MQPTFDSPFYRVAVKALIFDESQRLLVLKTKKGRWELPGGGWEHDEPYEDCLRREIKEELGVGVMSIGPMLFTYRGHNNDKGYEALRIVSVVSLDCFDFTCGEDMESAQFMDRAEFMKTDFVTNEGNVADYEDRIWPG